MKLQSNSVEPSTQAQGRVLGPADQAFTAGVRPGGRSHEADGALQAIAAVKQRRADTPNAVVDFTHTHGITGSADIGKTALVRGDFLAFDALRQQSRQALRLIHIANSTLADAPTNSGWASPFW